MRSIINLVFVLIITIVLIPATGCYYDKEELLYNGSGTINCTTISAKFNPDVNTIIKNKCATAGCHDATGAAGGVILETFTQIAARATRINQRTIVDKTMPASGPLNTAEIAVLKCWIDSGSPNN